MEPERVRIMPACAEMRRVSATVMLIAAAHHEHACRERAESCRSMAA